MPRFKLVFFAPVTSTQNILRQLFLSSPETIGKIGLYKSCAFVSRGTGQFLPQDGTAPNIGEVGKPEFVEEDRVEILVTDTEEKDEIKNTVKQLKKVHPYEEVAFEVYRLEDI